ncbi:MAG: Eco57I restriction-modification methylase domain-containing protein [Propionibacteriaceae bacterium]|nr:Eco57I restriction-modification methylase domain-containing protein [Propionibacteriaceae bacterium]
MSDGLLAEAEWVRVEATLGLTADTQSARGQFFTPEQAAVLIASMPHLPFGDPIKVLDPGAGSGMLTAAIVERLVSEAPSRKVEVRSVEVDASLIPALERTAGLCRDWAYSHGADVSVNVVQGDIIEHSTGLESQLKEEFDVVVMNPPYLKLGAGSPQRRALESLGWDAPNLYAAFLAIGVEALKPGGQLVAITPRSFANGPYFGQFRRKLLQQLAINRLHTFESRSTVFSDNGVLQENIVFSATKTRERGPVLITASQDHLGTITQRLVPYPELVSPLDQQQFIRIMIDDNDAQATTVIAALPATLNDLGLSVSTGRIVDFRVRENLTAQPTPACLPLVYPGNLRNGEVLWPRSMGKAQGFEIRREEDHRALMPEGCYVLVKRFSAKEERRRIVAAMWTPERNGNVPVAFENHLNVFHTRGYGLDFDVGWGLCLWLNSTVVDRYFRTFSGHTQVNATDLRSLRYPDAETLRYLGQTVGTLPDQKELDTLVDSVLGDKVTA